MFDKLVTSCRHILYNGQYAYSPTIIQESDLQNHVEGVLCAKQLSPKYEKGNVQPSGKKVKKKTLMPGNNFGVNFESSEKYLRYV